MFDENEIWDEFRWEEFMKEQDKKVDRYMELFYRYQDHPDRDEIIAREMGWKWLLDERLDDDESLSLDDTNDEGEEWKTSSDIFEDEQSTEELERHSHLPVYQKTKELALKAYRFVDELPEAKRQDSAVVDFVANAMIASAKIAGGTGMGNDIDELGANIAYCKRGLDASNLALAALHEMKEKGIITDMSYLSLIREATDVRNTIAIHILDLREKFRRGV
jgi:hypothetical protein